MNDLNLLEDPVDFSSECLTATSDGEPLRITKHESVMIKVKVLGEVGYPKNLERIIIFMVHSNKGVCARISRREACFGFLHRRRGRHGC